MASDPDAAADGNEEGSSRSSCWVYVDVLLLPKALDDTRGVFIDHVRHQLRQHGHRTATDGTELSSEYMTFRLRVIDDPDDAYVTTPCVESERLDDVEAVKARAEYLLLVAMWAATEATGYVTEGMRILGSRIEPDSGTT